VDVTLLPAVEQARLIASRELSASELLDQVVARYERFDPRVNAVVVERIELAQRHASAADTAVVKGEPLRRFHGVPATIKDVIDWTGTPSTWGDPKHAGYLPVRNAVVVDRLLDEGAIIWGKTNVPKDLELGSDIGGSLRIPAHYCGVASHKPSYGAVSQAGHAYPGQPAPVDVNVVGPMARAASDLAAIMPVLSDLRLAPEARSSLRDFTVGVMFENPTGGEQDEEMTAVLSGAVGELERAGLRVDSQLIRDQWHQYFENVDLLLCPVTAGVAPFHQTDVPFVDQTITVNDHLVSNQDQWVWFGMASGAYLPATVVPVGQTASGLPVGMQIIGPFAGDMRSIKLAMLIEQQLGGYRAPGLVID